MLIDLIDDDQFVCLMHAKMVNSAGWYSRSFRSARAYLAELAHSEPSCAVIDLAMPDMNGAELVGQLLAHERQVAVVIVTAQPLSLLADQARALGGIEVLAKPAYQEELLRAIRKAVARQHNEHLVYGSRQHSASSRFDSRDAVSRDCSDQQRPSYVMPVTGIEQTLPVPSSRAASPVLRRRRTDWSPPPG